MTITTDVRETNGVVAPSPRAESAFDLLVSRLNGLTGPHTAFPNGIAEIEFEQSGGPGPNLKLRIRALTGEAPSAGVATTNGAAKASRLQWNTPGHEVIALVAEKILAKEAPSTHRRILEIIGNDPRERCDITALASWPDEVKKSSEFHATAVWHFIDIVYQPDRKDLRQLPAAPHVVSAIGEQRRILSQRSDPGEVADALSFVIHLVGDIHQPLHCATLINDDFPAPDGDHGGNLLKFSGRHNFHSLWDDIVATSPTVADSLSDDLLTSCTRESLAKELGVKDVTNWAWESHDLARQAYDKILSEDDSERPSQGYLDWAKGVASTRVALAGYRLADVLKEALG